MSDGKLWCRITGLDLVPPPPILGNQLDDIELRTHIFIVGIRVAHEDGRVLDALRTFEGHRTKIMIQRDDFSLLEYAHQAVECADAILGVSTRISIRKDTIGLPPSICVSGIMGMEHRSEFSCWPLGRQPWLDRMLK